MERQHCINLLPVWPSVKDKYHNKVNNLTQFDCILNSPFLNIGHRKAKRKRKKEVRTATPQSKPRSGHSCLDLHPNYAKKKMKHKILSAEKVKYDFQRVKGKKKKYCISWLKSIILSLSPHIQTEFALFKG